jgi:hypothetical protein
LEDQKRADQAEQERINKYLQEKDDLAKQRQQAFQNNMAYFFLIIFNPLVPEK